MFEYFYIYLSITGARNKGSDFVDMCAGDPSNIATKSDDDTQSCNQATDNHDQSIIETVQPVDKKLNKGQSSNNESSNNKSKINESSKDECIKEPVLSGDLESNRDKNNEIGNINKRDKIEKESEHMKELQDTRNKLVDELGNVKNNLDQANKDLKQYGGVLHEVDKAIELNRALPPNAKDKNRYCKELDEKFSEITDPQNSRRKNLEEIVEYAKDEINSAEIWKAELRDKKTRLSEKLSSVEIELSKLRKDSDQSTDSSQGAGDPGQEEDSEKNISTALQKSLAERLVREAVLTEKRGLRERIHQETIDPYKKRQKEEAIKEEDEPEDSTKVINTGKDRTEHLSSSSPDNSIVHAPALPPVTKKQGEQEQKAEKNDSEEGSNTDNTNVTAESRTNTEGSGAGSSALIAGVSAIGEAIATAIQNIL